MLETRQKITLAFRINSSTYTLLSHISESTDLKKSTLLRAAVTQWLQNAPEELPLDLKIEITRANMQHHIETIKNLRWTYHQTRNAQIRIAELQKTSQLPPHTQETIRKLEQKIIDLQNQLDSWLKEQYEQGA